MVPVVVAAVALWPPLSTARLAYGVGLGVSYDLSLGMNGALYPTLYRWVPGYRGLRAAARFDVLVGLSLAVLAGFGVARLSARLRSTRARTVLAITLMGLAMLDSYAPPHLVETPRPVAAYSAFLRQAAPAVLAEVPFGNNNKKTGGDAVYEYFSAWHWQPLVNGMSGNYPPGYIDLEKEMRTFPNDASFESLRQLGVTHLAVHEAFYNPGDFAEVRDTLASRPDVQFVGRFGPDGSSVLVYVLAGARSPRAQGIPPP